jgi:hypothetical protein
MLLSDEQLASGNTQEFAGIGWDTGLLQLLEHFPSSVSASGPLCIRMYAYILLYIT